MFRSIIRAAVLSSPTTSPVKKELTAGMFSGVEGDKLDYGVLSLWDKIFTTEDDPDAELIEMD